jgi:hypothetical protein
MPARRRPRSLEIRVLAVIAARVSFGVPAQASCVRTTLPALMRRQRWRIIWLALAAASRARRRNRSLSDRPPMSRSNPAVLRSSSPSLGARLRPRLALRSHRCNLKIGQRPAPRRARCLTRARCRKRGHFRKSGMSSRHLQHRRPRRCCSRSKSSDRSAAASRARDVASLMTSVQSRQARRLPPLESRAHGELPRLLAQRSARLRPRAPPPRHATP